EERLLGPIRREAGGRGFRRVQITGELPHAAGDLCDSLLDVFDRSRHSLLPSPWIAPDLGRQTPRPETINVPRIPSGIPENYQETPNCENRGVDGHISQGTGTSLLGRTRLKRAVYREFRVRQGSRP